MTGLFAAVQESAFGTKRRKPRRRVYVSFWESKRKCMDGGPRLPSTRMSSRAEEFHLRALPDTYVNLSIHTAPDVRPLP